jgi:hypothetical protein
LFVTSEEDGGVWGDVGLNEVSGVELGEDLYDFGLSGRLIGELSADEFPAFGDGAGSIE